jgi:hypothetical protein
MTNVSELHLHRVVVNSKGTNFSSRSRAVRKAIKRYETGQYELDKIFIEVCKNAVSEWTLDQIGQQSFRAKAESIKPREPKVHTGTPKKAAAQKDAFNESIRHLAAVTKALTSRKDLSQYELETLWDAITGCGAYVEKALTKMVADRPMTEVK